MCTLILLRRPAHAWPLLLGANRDEMVDRPALPPARHWADRPEVVAGLDELAGGSWLGINDHGIVAGILNRFGTLGPEGGRRSRGELVLEALDHADARVAAAALATIEPASYRPFNLIIADNRDAYWIRHADPSGTLPVAVKALPEGISMIASGDVDDPESPRLRRYTPRFRTAPPPQPESGDWASWEALLGDSEGDAEAGARGAMNFALESGFATVSSALIALPAPGAEQRPIFRFAPRRPTAQPWRAVRL